MVLTLTPVDEVYRVFLFAFCLWLAGICVDRIGCPALVGELLVGMALGPHGADLLAVSTSQALSVAGQAGLIMMVLEGGIAMDAAGLKMQGVRAVVLAATGTVLPVLFGWWTMLALGQEQNSALACGIALSSTAIGFTLRMMTDLKLLHTQEGQLITAAAMIDDVFSLILLAMLSVLSDSSDGSALADGGGQPARGDSSGDSSGSRAWLFLRPLVASLAVCAVGYMAWRAWSGAARRAAALGAGRSAQTTRLLLLLPCDGQTSLAALVVLCGAVSAWLAQGIYSSSLLGAFTAGCVFCTTESAAHAYAKAQPVQAWLSRFFFGCTVAFVVPIRDLFDSSAIGDGLLLTLVAIAGKFLSGAWGVSLFDGGRIAGPTYWGAFVRVGTAMIGRGELGFMLITASRADGLVSDRGYSATIWALLLATLVGPYAYRLSLKLATCGVEAGVGNGTDAGTGTCRGTSTGAGNGGQSEIEVTHHATHEVEQL